MNKSSIPSNSNPSSQNLCGILYLPMAPEIWDSKDWYAEPIAGVPFLSRNILTLQRSGFHEIIIYMDADGAEKLAPLLEKDPRVNVKIHWITKLDFLKVTLQNRRSQVLFFNGSALHDKKEVRSLLENEGIKTPEAFTISNEQIESFLEKIKAHGNKESKEFLKNSRSLIFIPGADHSQLRHPKDFKAMHERLLKGSGQNHDSAITRFLSRPVSRKLTRLFLNTPITPNQITLLSFAMGLGSAVGFAQGTYPMGVLGALLLLFSTWVDGADGEIARLKFMESESGGKLDIICDNIVHFFVFGAIGWGMGKATGDQTYIYLGALAAFASLASFILLGAVILKKNTNTRSTPSPTQSQTPLAEKLANRDFIHFLMLMAVTDLVQVFIVIAAIGAALFTSYLTYLRFTELRMAQSS